MDMGKLDKMPGMAAGFPFAMVLLGIVGAVGGSVLRGINEYFFNNFGGGLVAVGVELIQWGSVLQGVLWICSAFAKKSTTP